MTDLLLAVAPFGLDFWMVPLLIGVAFGWVLESSGFGDSRQLAAQFYFKDIRVVRVMFTAIVTCMLLLLWASALGFLDLEALFVNPTYLGSGILGGLLLGFGFIIGGYCPGTSLTSAATLKIDGFIFVVGVAGGSYLFSETADEFRLFYDTAGALGRVTLPEFLGLSVGVVAVLVVLMAVGMFVFMGVLERGSRKEEEERPSVWGPLAKGGIVAVAAFLLLALALPVVGQPTVEDRVARLAPEHDPILERRAIHVDPVEVLGLMHNEIHGKPGRVRLVLVDLRSESDYNLFHLANALRLSLEDLAGDAGKALAGQDYANAFKILVSQEEEIAEQGWRILKARGADAVYVLAGGVDLWLELFMEPGEKGRSDKPSADGGDLRHVFSEALGDRYTFSLPSFPVYQRQLKRVDRPVEFKIEPIAAAPTGAGGCG